MAYQGRERSKTSIIAPVRMVWPALAILIAVLLSACGGESDITPQLAAPPTRTPVPATDTPDAALPALDFEIVSLKNAVDAFLTASESASALSRIDLFIEHVITPQPDCFTATRWPGMQPMELVGNVINVTSADLAAWRQAADSFPEDALIREATNALARAGALLPTEAPFRLCLIPLPGRGQPEDMPYGGVSSMVLGGDRVIAVCSAGDRCVEALAASVARGYAYAYQVGQAGLAEWETPLLELIVFNGRADAFTRQLFPDATLPWDDALTAEQEARLWDDMQPYLATTAQDYPDGRKIDRFLWGTQNTTVYPTYGGVAIGGQIVRAYRAAHPEASLPDLMALAAEDLLAQSGYAPGSAGVSSAGW